MNETHAEAHKLHRSGLPITLCPKNGKNPLGDGWNAKFAGKAWQRKRWTLKEIDRAFKVRGELNVGVLFGAESGLIDIEEDAPEDAAAFAELLEGAAPPVTAAFRSKRGPHRLFQHDPDLDQIGKATVAYQGLEIKLGANGKGSHSLFPPSVTNGTARQWLVPLDECPAAPLPKTAKQRLLERFCGKAAAEGVKGRNGTQRTQTSHEITAPSVSSVFPASTHTSLPLNALVKNAIAVTVPNAGGLRHRCVFTFARHLKAIPALVDADEETLRPYVEWWHEVALPAITTKPFEETWYDFRNAWRSVNFPVGEGPISIMYEKAVSKPMPKCAEMYQQPQLRALVALCRELQQAAGDEPFFLAGRVAAEQIGVDHKVAWRWLKMLCMDRVLQLDERGTRHQASEYRYLGGD